MDEIWKGIPGFTGSYEVSNCGRVRSLSRQVQCKDGAFRTFHGRILKPWRSVGGYNQVYLPGRKPKLVHRLVLEAFVGPAPEGTECRHLDGDKENNRLDNLQWSTHVENERDKKAHGTDWQTNKTHCPRNHPLVEPNLVPTRLKRGFRLCRACDREYARSWRFNVTFDVEKADENYALILEGKMRVKGGGIR